MFKIIFYSLFSILETLYKINTVLNVYFTTLYDINKDKLNSVGTEEE